MFFIYLLRISLNTMTLNVESPKVYTRHGVPISVTGIAQVSYRQLDNFSYLYKPIVVIFGIVLIFGFQ